MITQVLHGSCCHETDIVRHGLSPEGKQRYRCRQCLEGRGRTFLLEYAYAGQSPAVKQQIVDMAMNASGIRDTARVLHVSPTTVIKELKKGTCTRASESGGVAAPAPRAREVEIWRADAHWRCVAGSALNSTRCEATCSGLQSKCVRTAISAFSGPHYLHLSPISGPHYMRLRLQSSGRDCNPSSQDRIICN